MTEIRILNENDTPLFASVADDVFDNAIDAACLQDFLADPRHHIAAAIADGVIVGFASAIHYVHPDKPPELWINEVGVACAFRRRGLAKALITALFEKARALECREAWVLTERGNKAAMALYKSLDGEQMPEETTGFVFPLDANAKEI